MSLPSTHGHPEKAADHRLGGRLSPGTELPASGTRRDPRLSFKLRGLQYVLGQPERPQLRKKANCKPWGRAQNPKDRPLRGAAVAQQAQGRHRVISTLQGTKNEV